jgi:hypothetical protein
MKDLELVANTQLPTKLYNKVKYCLLTRMSEDATAVECDVPVAIVERVQKEIDDDPGMADTEVTKRELQDVKFKAIAVAKEKLDNADECTLRDVTGVIATVVDKQRLLENKSTANIAVEGIMTAITAATRMGEEKAMNDALEAKAREEKKT